MRKLLILMLVGVLAACLGCPRQPPGGGPPEQGGPPYVGDWNEEPPGGGGRTLHINQPSDCRCDVAKQLASHPSAVFFNDLQTAHEAGFTVHCPACSAMGAQCTFE